MALDLARRVSATSDHKDPGIEQTLAVAQFHSGDAAALVTLDAALQLPALQGNAFQRQRLQQYRDGIAKGSLQSADERRDR